MDMERIWNPPLPVEPLSSLPGEAILENGDRPDSPGFYYCNLDGSDRGYSASNTLAVYVDL